jgi:hypothetical protein
MSVAEGVALWTSYMKRSRLSAIQPTTRFNLRFTDLIDDWRRVVGAISSRLNLALDVHTREGEIDRFLEPSLRRQRSDPTALAALPDGTVNAAAPRASTNALIAGASARAEWPPRERWRGAIRYAARLRLPGGRR